MKPIRIQRKRTKGWRMPPNTICVTRPGKWGNPFFAKGNNEHFVHLFEDFVNGSPIYQDAAYIELRGKNLACFCKLDQPCHADVLLKIANR